MREVRILFGKVGILSRKVRILLRRVCILLREVGILLGKVTILFDKVSVLLPKVGILFGKVTILFEKVTILLRGLWILIRGLSSPRKRIRGSRQPFASPPPRIHAPSRSIPSSVLTFGAHPKSRRAPRMSNQWAVDSCRTMNRVSIGSSSRPSAP